MKYTCDDVWRRIGCSVVSSQAYYGSSIENHPEQAIASLLQNGVNGDPNIDQLVVQADVEL